MRDRKKQSHATGLLTARTEGWKLPVLLFQLLFSLGSPGDISPDTEVWNTTNGIDSWQKYETAGIFPIGEGIHTIVTNAIRSILEVYFWNQAKYLDIENLSLGEYLIANARCHRLCLRWMNKVVLSLPRDLSKGHISDLDKLCDIGKANKPHYLGHLIDTKMMYGALKG